MSDGTRGNTNPKKQKLSGVGESNLLRKETFVSSTPAPLFDNMHRGYFPLWRKIRDWGWYKDVNTKSVFIELLLLSNFKENYYLGHKIQRGQCVAGRKTLSASLGLSERQIRTALKRLLSTSEITIKNCNKFSIITLNNFETYLINDQRAVQQTTSKRPDIDQRSTTPYNDKKEKNVKNDNIDNPILSPQKYFYLKHKEVFKGDYVASFAKDGAIFKSIRAQVEDTELFSLIDKFFVSQDPFIIKAGYTIGVFKSQINKLREVKHGRNEGNAGEDRRKELDNIGQVVE